MNGNELASKLRALYPHLRLIAVSAVGQLPATLVGAVDSHVQKGHDPELLLSVISAVLAGPSSAGSPGSTHVQSPKTVLCVDDEKLQLQLRKMLLESAGFIVLAAQSSDDAMHGYVPRASCGCCGNGLLVIGKQRYCTSGTDEEASPQSSDSDVVRFFFVARRGRSG
jgi:hypothetical protein